MKKILLVTFTISALLLASCDKGDDPALISKFEYHAHIMSPTVSNKYMQDSMDIIVHFESHTAETVHNVNVSIMEKNGGKVIYNMPTDSHVHGMSGEYKYTDRVLLDSITGYKGHTDYIIRAKVWGNAPGLEEVTEELQFHVHPKK